MSNIREAQRLRDQSTGSGWKEAGLDTLAAARNSGISQEAAVLAHEEMELGNYDQADYYFALAQAEGGYLPPDSPEGNLGYDLEPARRFRDKELIDASKAPESRPIENDEETMGGGCGAGAAASTGR